MAIIDNMRKTLIIALALSMLSCADKDDNLIDSIPRHTADSLALATMVMERERAMIKKDVSLAMSHFSEDATWINSQGYLFEGEKHVKEFHTMMTSRDSVDYYYEIGEPRIRLIDTKNAIVYYSWKMFWYSKFNPTDTTFKEIGLMTLHANKQSDQWKWIAVTNQHTPWFYERIVAVE